MWRSALVFVLVSLLCFLCLSSLCRWDRDLLLQCVSLDVRASGHLVFNVTESLFHCFPLESSNLVPPPSSRHLNEMP